MASKNQRTRRPQGYRRTLTKWILAICGTAVAGAGLYFFGEAWLSAADIKLLVPEHGASWIRVDRPFSLAGWGNTREFVKFRKNVVVPDLGGPHVLWVRAFRRCQVIWDGKTLFGSNPAREDWKQPIRVALATDLAPGQHTLEVRVINEFAPAALLAYSDTLDVKTGADWEETHGAAPSRRVATVDEIKLPELSHRFTSTMHALRSALWWFGPLFLVVWSGLLLNARRASLPGASRLFTASTCRWVVIAAWSILAANNFSRLPSEVGYDHSAHVDYIRFISERGELPDASGGLQMFQAPLYYAISAAIYRMLTRFTSSDAALIWLRWIPLLCGIGQVEICCRAGRRLFPGRDDLQSLTLLVGGLLPLNLYMSQVIGNEPLSGLLTALLLLMSWEGTSVPVVAQRPRWQWQMGLIFGIALLAKVSALALAPIVAAVLIGTNRTRGSMAAMKACVRCFVAAAIVSGWYFVRNCQRFGKPIVGGWDPVTGILWWQDPGYRTPSQITSFGQSLLHPIHSGFYSIWDGLFSTLWLDGNLSSMGTWKSRPPWNEMLLLSAPWPGLLLTIAIAAGVVRGIRCRDLGLRRALQIAGGSLLLYVAATFVLFLEVPAFSQAKASYTLGLTPAYAVLCVAGLELLPQHRLIRSAATAFIISWGAAAYCTYFVR
jgi:hypothetical protein